MGNAIINNLNQFYPSVSLPSIKEIRQKADFLILCGYRTKKGKLLVEGYGHNPTESFLEDNIDLFQRLTQNGYMNPTVSIDSNCKRVVDSFVLMPSWIRGLCEIDGDYIKELDFSCLHPNLIMKIYGGTTKGITHEEVAKELNIGIKQVKIEHLGFFNKRWEHMKKSVLYEYYQEKESELLSRIKSDKKKHGYKVTSHKLFEMEVELMSKIISQLNEMEIYVGYVYDALFCGWEQVKLVKQVMNLEAEKMGIYTKVK